MNDSQNSIRLAKNVIMEQPFANIEDFRVKKRCLYKLEEILFIALCTIICHGDDFEDMVSFGEEKIDWLKSYLELENGIPSHDTFNRVLQFIEPEYFREILLEDGKALVDLVAENHISFDGKKIKGVSPKSRGNHGLYILSAWANEARICIGQEKIQDKSNEITAIPKLLDKLDISNNTITIDAIGCQTEIAAKIIENDADYILAVKQNQGNLHEEIEESFKHFGVKNKVLDDSRINETWEYDHGRFERRTCSILNAKDVLYEELLSKWKGLSTIIQVISERTVNNVTSTETRFYISSKIVKTAEYYNKITRGHWGIENHLHWHLDVTFNEDKCRARRGHSAENLNILRKAALHRVSQLKDKKSINKRRYRASLNEEYLEKILFASKLKF
jgi:predicted transposase YbfD/YdcC